MGKYNLWWRSIPSDVPCPFRMLDWFLLCVICIETHPKNATVLNALIVTHWNLLRCPPKRNCKQFTCSQPLIWIFLAETVAMQMLNDYISKDPWDIAAWNKMAKACLAMSNFWGTAYFPTAVCCLWSSAAESGCTAPPLPRGDRPWSIPLTCCGASQNRQRVLHKPLGERKWWEAAIIIRLMLSTICNQPRGTYITLHAFVLHSRSPGVEHASL